MTPLAQVLLWWLVYAVVGSLAFAAFAWWCCRAPSDRETTE